MAKKDLGKRGYGRLPIDDIKQTSARRLWDEESVEKDDSSVYPDAYHMKVGSSVRVFRGKQKSAFRHHGPHGKRVQIRADNQEKDLKKQSTHSRKDSTTSVQDRYASSMVEKRQNQDGKRQNQDGKRQNQDGWRKTQFRHEGSDQHHSRGQTVEQGRIRHLKSTQERFDQSSKVSQASRYRIPRLSIEKLVELSRLPDSTKVISFIFNNLKEFQQSLGTCGGVSKIRHYIEIILRILRKICETPIDHQEYANRILAEVLNGDRCAQFHMQLKIYVSQELSMEQAWDLIHLFLKILRFLPGSSCVLPVRDLVKSISYMNNDSLIKQADDLKQSFDGIQRKRPKKVMKDITFLNWDNSQYRDIPLYPTMEEVCIEDSAQLRPSLITEAYTGWEHYYDVQFRLLREDFIAPLRRGIKQFIANEKGKRNMDVNIYHNVRILEPVFTREGICYKVQFDISMFRQRRSWEHSKRLIFGSLLCLSPRSDNFREEVYFAIVANRDPKDLENGIVQLHFQESVLLIPHCNQTVFVMAESRAYFEASRHILHSLQTAEIDTMPFTKYLVLNQTVPVNKPKYLNDSIALYDITCLYGAEESFGEPKIIDILNKRAWPLAEQIELDQSQLDAIQMALTQEIAVIQGPPGTGKTYIGIKIVQTLLQNKDKTGRHPILVLCYTNHALDQFLEGILDQYETDCSETCVFTENLMPTKKPKIVRIGGRSQRERIQDLNITKLRPSVPWNLRSERAMILEAINHCPQSIPWNNLKILTQFPISTFIIEPDGVQELKSTVILPHHWYQLTKVATEEGNGLEVWLGLWEECMLDQSYNDEPTLTEGSTSEDEDQMEKDATRIQNEEQRTNFQEESSEELEPIVTDQSVSEELAESQENWMDVIEPDLQEEESSEELIDVIGEAFLEEEARMIDDAFKPINVSNDEIIDANTEKNLDSKKVDLSVDVHQSKTNTTQINSKKSKKSLRKQKVKVIKRKSDKEISRILQHRNFSTEPMEEEEVNEVRDVTLLCSNKRWSLLRYWVKSYQEHLLHTNKEMFKEYTSLCERLKIVQQRMDQYALEEADIIGMTTTGAAKYQHILHRVKPRIVIVEEAAEVLESHIVSSLNNGTQHLILIGDHKQLRPKPNMPNLARDYKLDISLFERLLINDLPHATLLIQHRMRPEIARLVCPHIYDQLENHPSVEQYGNVKGFTKKQGGIQNLYFFNHEQPEEEDSYILSHSNEFEADFVAELCHHLLNQNYKPTQITILTGYTGQLLKVRSKMPKKTFEGVRIVNVDNFQGEENDIIILSLTRSNREGRVGFLRESNRVCVALSRAKMGFYCFGNFTMLRKEVPIWETILSDMEKRGCVGNAFHIYCQNHPEKIFEIKAAKDFALFAPEGGCKEICNYRLECGHSCSRQCHNTDPNHKQSVCKKPCQRLCEKGEHRCVSICNKICPPCRVSVTRTLEACGHTQKMYCHEKKCKCLCNKLCDNGLHFCEQICHVGSQCRSCQVLVQKEMPICKHLLTVPCYKDLTSLKCWAICQKQYPICGHKVDMKCYKTPEQSNCLHPCEKVLVCGHNCVKACGEICSINSCRKEVIVQLTCGHSVEAICREVWSDSVTGHAPYRYELVKTPTNVFHVNPQPILCTMPCGNTLKCGHSCQNKCGSQCTTQCMVKVDDKWPCGHRLKRRCYQTQNKEMHPCTKPCTKMLSCGHQCLKKCGETCTEVCYQLVNRSCPCGHVHKLGCNAALDYCPCKEICNHVLKCGHTCTGKCGQCYSSRIHQACPHDVFINRFCGHSGAVPCFGILDVCQKTCPIGCTHSSCSHTCERDTPCKTECEQPCGWKCDHFECSQPCYAPCDRPVCHQPCTKLLSCKHICPGVCGEPCLRVCWQCNQNKFRTKLVLEKRTRLDDKLFIQLDCNHIFSVKFLDQRFKRIEERGLICPLQCPFKSCSKPVLTSGRYFKQVKEQMKVIRAIAEDMKPTEMELEDTEIKFNVQATRLLSSIPPITAQKQGRKLIKIDPNKNPEVLFAIKLYISVNQFSEKIVAFYAKKAARIFSQKIYNLIKTNEGRVSAQFVADVRRELYLLCMQEVIESTDIDADMSPREQTSFTKAKIALQRLKNDYHCEFTEEECECYLLPLERIYLQETNQTIDDIIPFLPSPPRATKGDCYTCPSGHMYFVPAHYQQTELQCPNCLIK